MSIRQPTPMQNTQATWSRATALTAETVASSIAGNQGNPSDFSKLSRVILDSLT